MSGGYDSDEERWERDYSSSDGPDYDDYCRCSGPFCRRDGVQPPVVCDECCRCDHGRDDFTCSACEKAWRSFDEWLAVLDLAPFVRALHARRKYSASRRVVPLANGRSILMRLVAPVTWVPSVIRLGPTSLVMGPGFGIRYQGRYKTYPVVYAASQTRQWFDLVPERQLTLKETVLLLMSVANRLPDVEPVVMTRLMCLPLILRLSTLPEDLHPNIMRFFEFA